MTVVSIVHSPEQAQVLLQLVTPNTGAASFIGGEPVAAVEPLLFVYLTADIDEADSCNDGVFYISPIDAGGSDNLERDEEFIPKKVYFFEANTFYIHSNAIPVTKVDDIKSAGWRVPRLAAAKRRCDTIREKLAQQRPSKYSDRIPKRYQMPLINVPRAYLKTIVPCEVSSSIAKHGVILTILPENTVVEVHKICTWSESTLYSSEDVKIRVKLLSKYLNIGNQQIHFSETVVNSGSDRVHDINFGSDGWITYEVGNSMKQCQFIDLSIEEDIADIGPEFLHGYSISKQINVFPRDKALESYNFEAFKAAVGNDSSVWGKPRYPRYRYFHVYAGILTVFDNPNSRNIGKQPLKSRRIELQNCKVFIRKPSDSSCLPINTPFLTNLTIDYLTYVMNNYNDAAKKRSQKTSEVLKNEVTEASGIVKSFFTSKFKNLKSDLSQTIHGLSGEGYNLTSSDQVAKAQAENITEEFDAFWDVIYIAWSFEHDSNGGEIPERDSNSNLILFVNSDMAQSFANVLGHQGALLEKATRWGDL